MKPKRLQQYLENKKTAPIQKKEEIAHHPDKRIDQDFPGYPHGPANEETIKPKTKQQRKTAAVNTKDGEKQIIPPAKRKKARDEEDQDDGSGRGILGDGGGEGIVLGVGPACR